MLWLVFVMSAVDPSLESLMNVHAASFTPYHHTPKTLMQRSEALGIRTCC